VPQVIFAGSVLQITAEPDVSIWLNNEYVGKTAKKENGLVIKDLEPGEYNLRAARKGYESVEIMLNAEDNQTIEWRINLVKPVMDIVDTVRRIDVAMVETKPVGTITLKSIPLGAEVFFNGKSIGKSDKRINYAPASDYSVKFVFQGSELLEKISLQPGAAIIVTADFTKGEIVKDLIEVDTGQGPAVIKMQTARKKKPAMFPHRMHQEMYGCEVCHHGSDDAGNKVAYTEGMAIQHCVTCHNPKMGNKKLNNLMQASHVKCKGCHKKVVAESGTAGPIGKCSGCHNVPDGK
jgi:hypothetical protein